MKNNPSIYGMPLTVLSSSTAIKENVRKVFFLTGCHGFDIICNRMGSLTSLFLQFQELLQSFVMFWRYLHSTIEQNK